VPQVSDPVHGRRRFPLAVSFGCEPHKTAGLVFWLHALGIPIFWKISIKCFKVFMKCGYAIIRKHSKFHLRLGVTLHFSEISHIIMRTGEASCQQELWS